MNKLFSFHVDCGRMGDLEGSFVATQEEVDGLIGEEVHFGEALGKHSEVSLEMKEEYFSVKTDNQEFLKLAEEIGVDLDSGYNPFEYLED